MDVGNFFTDPTAAINCESESQCVFQYTVTRFTDGFSMTKDMGHGIQPPVRNSMEDFSML